MVQIIIVDGLQIIQYGPNIIHYELGNIDTGLDLSGSTRRGELITPPSEALTREVP